MSLLGLLCAISLLALPFSARALPRAGAGAELRRPHANTCTLTTLKMAFGPYAPLTTNLTTPLEITGSLKVKCTSGLGYSLTADTGLHGADATGSCATAACTRALNTGTAYVSYDLYTDNTYTTVWNASNSIGGTGTGAAVTVDFYGYIPAGIANTPGTYGDTVTVTVTY